MQTLNHALCEFVQRTRRVQAKEISAPSATTSKGTPFLELDERVQGFSLSKFCFANEGKDIAIFSTSEGFH